MSLQRLVEEQGFAVLDGGLSTCLEESGYSLDRALWSGYAPVDNPDGVVAMHQQFLDAGADILTTCSYQMSYQGFAGKGIDGPRAEDLFRAGTRLAAAAVAGSSRPGLVAASVGTFGAHLSDGSEYSGRFGKSTQELVEWHRPKFRILAQSGCDVLACETVPCIDEVRAFQKLIVQDSSPSMSSWVSMSCRSGSQLNSGESVEDAVRALEDPSGEEGAADERLSRRIGIGVNCTAPEHIANLLQIISDNVTKSRVIVVYPNSGEVWDGLEKKWNAGGDASSVNEEFSDEMVRSWHRSGASVIGGCCRCTPTTIAGIRRALEQLP